MQYERIKSPKTNRVIYVHGDAYNNLLTEYTEEYLNSLPRLYTAIEPKSPKYKKSIKSKNINIADDYKIPNNNDYKIPNNLSMMNQDVFLHTFLEAEPESVINLCQANKDMNNYCTDYFWKLKIKRDYPIVKLNSDNYKKEYIKLTKLYKKAVDTLKMIQLYKEDNIDFRTIVFMLNNKGFDKLDEIYWLPKEITDKFVDAKRLRVMLLSTSRYHYYLHPVNITTMTSPSIEVSQQQMIELLWLLMYHFDIDILDLDKGESFLYDKLLQGKGKERNLRLKYWKKI